MPPLVHLGSTFTKILSARTVKISGVPVCDGNTVLVDKGS